jgi:hypothetical protein
VSSKTILPVTLVIVTSLNPEILTLLIAELILIGLISFNKLETYTLPKKNDCVFDVNEFVFN